MIKQMRPVARHLPSGEPCTYPRATVAIYKTKYIIFMLDGALVCKIRKCIKINLLFFNVQTYEPAHSLLGVKCLPNPVDITTWKPSPTLRNEFCLSLYCVV